MATTTTATKNAKTAAAAKGPKAKAPDIFVWQGKDKKGQTIKGEMKSTSLTAAKAQLRAQGIANAKVRKKPQPLFGGGGGSIKPADIAIFTRQMATMMKAGVPLVQSFELVAEGVESGALRKMIMDIRDEIAGGGSFASGLRKYPRYFDNLFCSLIESGEQSGALETMLDRVATYQEKTEAMKKKIKKAMTYPISVIVVAVIVTAVLLIKVVPTFAQTFSSFGAELPAFTLFVLHLSEAVQAGWMYALGFFILFGVTFSQAKQNSQAVRDALDRMVLKLPIVGGIVYEATVARVARTLATTFAAGVPLVDALTSVSGAAGNVVFRNAVNRVRDEVTGGTQMNVAFRSAGVFPTLLIQMTLIGEESGALDSMLEKVALHYEAEVDNKVDNLTTLLEPLIMSVLGVLVGGLLIAMYLPIFKLGAVVG